MPGAIKRLAGPVFLASGVANIIAAPAAGSKYVIRRMHFCNRDSSSRTFSIYVGGSGASAAGTEIFKDKSIPANDVYERWMALELTSSDYLTGGCVVSSGIVCTIEGEKTYL